MTKKKSFEEWQEIAIQRNHIISNPSNPETPSQGSFDVQCNTCGTKFTTLAKN